MILQVLITMIAGWVNRHQQQVITYLLEENRTLHAKLSVQRIRFTDAERRRLAALAFPLDCKRLKSLATLATPDTLMRWYKQLVAQKFVGESSLRYTLTQYLTHYHSEGNHQGLDNQLIIPEPEVRVSTGQVKRREHLVISDRKRAPQARPKSYRLIHYPGSW